jgi:hypothetical protein
VDRVPRLALCALALGAGLGCQTAPEPAGACRERAEGASVEIDCESDPSQTWSRDALDEAQESMEERRPGGRR